MTPERWQQIGAVLHGALGLAGDSRRRAYLEATCAGDDDLRQEVESLLASHLPDGHSFLDTPPAYAQAGLADARPFPEIGVRIGPYEIREAIGRGGMGDVYRARRADGAYDQQVAIKLIRSGFERTPTLFERFRTERQILAKLDHPNIARLIDGGTTGAGVPYLVMELVEGTRITEYSDTHGLDIRARVQLFQQVCAAVQYAHQHLVIHRDIKPGHILVTADGTPKLLDFGIAKILDPLASPEQTLVRLFTPEYASPEQVRGEPVTTATDVYSLALVLYQLLTGGAYPYRTESRTAGAIGDAIVNQEPARPSTVAPQRRELRGDLEAILLKALRKEPDKRYSSVEQLGEDIGRYLDGRPVSARSGTWRYRAGKFIRRHRAAVTSAALVFVTLVAGIVVTVREARIAEANRRRAEARFNDVRKLANSLLFEIHDSIQNLPGATDARKLILQRSLEYLDGLAKDSANEPGLLRELATAYDRIGTLQGDPFTMYVGEMKEARASFQKSVAMHEILARSNPRDRGEQVALARAYNHYGELLAGGNGDVRSGLEYQHRALAILDREAQAAPDDQQIAALSAGVLTSAGFIETGNGLMGRAGLVRQGIADLERAQELTDRALQRAPGDARLEYRKGTVELAVGQAFVILGERSTALTHYQSAIPVLDRVARAGNDVAAAFNRAVAYCKIGDVFLIEGRPTDARPFYVEGERSMSRLAVSDPNNTTVQRQAAIALVELGHVQLELGEKGAGLRLMRSALVKIEADRTGTPLARSIEALIRSWLGEGLERTGSTRDALRQYAIAKEKLGAVRAAGVNDPRIAGYYAAACARHAAALAKLGDTEQALQEYEEGRTILEPLVGADPGMQELSYVLAETYTAEGTIVASRAERAPAREGALAAWGEAATWFRKSLDTWSKVPHPARISTSGFEVTVPGEVAGRLARCSREIGRLERASHRSTARGMGSS